MAKNTKKQEEVTEQVKTEVEAPSFIEPTIQIEGHTNAFIKHLQDNQPEIVGIGFARIPGTKDYAAYTIKIVGDKVVKMIVDEPNLRNIAEESSKILFAEAFIRDEEF